VKLICTQEHVFASKDRQLGSMLLQREESSLKLSGLIRRLLMFQKPLTDNLLEKLFSIWQIKLTSKTSSCPDPDRRMVGHDLLKGVVRCLVAVKGAMNAETAVTAVAMTNVSTFILARISLPCIYLG
jgi:hypothetical protein